MNESLSHLCKGSFICYHTTLLSFFPEFRKATALVHLPLSCYQMPKEEFPPSPECWRQHPSKPHSVPYCYSQRPEIYSHWHTLYDQREEREGQKILWKMRDTPSLDGQELTQSLKSPREDEQHYAAQALGCLGINDKFIMEALREVVSLGLCGVPGRGKQSVRCRGQAHGHGQCSPGGARTLGQTQGRESHQWWAEMIPKPLTFYHLWYAFTTCLLNQAKTGPEKVKFEAYRSLALLGCLNKHVIQALIHHLKGQNEARRMETLVGLRVALNNRVAVPKDKRTQVGDEEKLVPLLQMLMKALPNDAALEAALCLGFLKPCSKVVREFLLQCLGQGPKTQKMKALRMLVKVMHVHSATVIKAILEQLCSSSVLEHRFEATKMLRTIGLEKIQAEGLEGLTFDLLRKKVYNEPFLAMRQAVAETVEELKMKPMMMNLVEAQLMHSSTTARQEAVISLGVLGIRSPHVYHLLLDMLDAEKNQDMKKSLQKTLILLASTDPWVRKKLKNKVLFVYEAPETNVKPEPTRFRKEPESPEEFTIQDFQLAQLSPLFVVKSSIKMDQQEKLTGSVLHATMSSDLYAATAFSSCFSNPVKDTSQAKGPWELKIRRQLQTLAKTSKNISSLPDDASQAPHTSHE
ncbi:protein HEATR9 [Trichechus inunguis]